MLNGYVQVHGTPLLTYCSSSDSFVTFCARVARRVGTLGAESYESWRVALLVDFKPQPLNDEMKPHLWALLLKEFQTLTKSLERDASLFHKADEYEYDDDDNERLLARYPTLGPSAAPIAAARRLRPIRAGHQDAATTLRSAYPGRAMQGRASS